MKVYKSVTELIGRTPLVELGNYCRVNKLKAKIIAKVEKFNPAGSVKDRIALSMINDAEHKGILKNGAVIIEPTSGNTGIGLAAIAAARGYRLILTMPANMSVERQKLLKAYGAELVLTDSARGMAGAIEKAKELMKKNKGAVSFGQFDNPTNPRAHEETTGPEIWEDTEGNINIVVFGIGTGGTISGVGRYLKSKNPGIYIVGVEPEDSAVLSGKPAAPHIIQGIGAGFIPGVLDIGIIDEIMTVSGANAISASLAVAKSDGLFVGISSGAALWAATELARRKNCAYKNIVVVFPDSGERYLSVLGGQND